VHGDPCRNPTLTIDEYCATLSSHNDGENVPARTFAEIADAIEEQL
jgi:hypothetical protein